ncbi:MAG TPA: hypothetical protein VHO66_10840 [Ruminiclostridium sp.]|nr:hypothetical protein [Ruminiclostridium sp.]
MSEPEGIKSVIEKYCPIVKHNVAVEVTRCGHTELSSRCLNKHNCEQENGGCSNSLFNS